MDEMVLVGREGDDCCGRGDKMKCEKEVPERIVASKLPRRIHRPPFDRVTAIGCVKIVGCVTCGIFLGNFIGAAISEILEAKAGIHHGGEDEGSDLFDETDDDP